MSVYLVASYTDLETKLAEAGSNLVVIFFFATWSGPSKSISPKVEELAKEYPDVVFLKVDIDESEDIAMKYDITANPTFIFLKDTSMIESFAGANFEKLKDCVQNLK